MHEQLLYTVENGVATLTLNRPDVHNAFNELLIAEMTQFFQKAGADKKVRAVVLRGNGKSFSAGGDLNWMRRVAEYTPEQNRVDAERLSILLETINTLPKPTLALVHGNAFGGGVGLAACCDIAVAEEGTQFCLSEVRVGIIPSIIAPYVMRCIGERHARRYFLTAERFDAVEAQRIGLVHALASKGEMDVLKDAFLKNIWDGAPTAQARGKKVILEISGKPIDESIRQFTTAQIAEARASEEGKEGLNCFLNKTDPSWRKQG